MSAENKLVQNSNENKEEDDAVKLQHLTDQLKLILSKDISGPTVTWRVTPEEKEKWMNNLLQGASQIGYK